MGFMDTIKEQFGDKGKARTWRGKHGDKVDEGVDRAGHAADKRTGESTASRSTRHRQGPRTPWASGPTRAAAATSTDHVRAARRRPRGTRARGRRQDAAVHSGPRIRGTRARGRRRVPGGDAGRHGARVRQ